jgi:hypothetical protein
MRFFSRKCGEKWDYGGCLWGQVLKLDFLIIKEALVKTLENPGFET